MASRYEHLNREELLRLLEARDRRDTTRFGLVWEANEIERDQALNNDFVALDLAPELSVGPAPWRNLIIEGDNFDALRYLRMTFAGQVKCILIDPPYNTGKKDFIYNDRFVDENNSWRFSTWIEFLYQRLAIARDLLREDGVLLCCINDENRAKLEMLLDKVMPGRRLGSFVWRTKDSANDAGGNLSQVHEHVLVYANRDFAFAGKPLVLTDYRNHDNDQRGDWTPQPLTKAATLQSRENTYYPVQDPDTGYWYPCDPDRVWAYATESRLKPGQQLRAETMEELIRRKEIWFPPCKPEEVMRFKTKDELLNAIRSGKGPVLPKKKKPLLREDLPDLDFWIDKPIAPGRPSRKDFLKKKEKMVAPVSSWIAGEKEKMDYFYDEQEEQMELLRSARGGEGSDALVAILGKKAFDHPKPPSLIRTLVQQATGPDDLILDFFAGSGTTAQAVLELNKADGERGRRRFILVSSTEATEDEPEKNICRDVCAQRVGNVIRGYRNAPALAGDFAYLRTRRITPGKLLEIDHAQVWTALQLAHGDTVAPFVEAPFLWSGDEDFGVQLVGRILRVHRRLQARARAKSLPDLLRYGYVFLADAEAQAGLDLAGQRINKLQTEYAKVSPTTALVNFGGKLHVQVLGPDGQTRFLPVATPGVKVCEEPGTGASTRVDTGEGNFTLEMLEGFVLPAVPTPSNATSTQSRNEIVVTPSSARGYRYPLRPDVPRRFKTQVVSPDNEATEEDCAKRFMVSSGEIVRALAAKVQVERRTLEVFTQQLEMQFTNAAMDPDHAARAAFKVLTRNEHFDARELRRALLRKLKATLQEFALDEAEDDEKIAHMLNVILTGHPELLYSAQKAALAANCEVEATEEELPAEISCDAPLPTSRHNVYRVVPADLNTWESEFAQLLDSDMHGVVRWWHRNLPHKPWSVQVVLDNGGGFFPDFIIGIEGRMRESGALLTDPKFQFELTQEEPKTYAEHPTYGRVLILNRQGGAQWMTVRFDEQRKKAVLDREFRLADAVGY